MSADNGIYVLVTKRTRVCEEISGSGVIGKCWGDRKDHLVYRVAHTQAIDNLNSYQQNEPRNLGAYMVDVWGQSKVYMTPEAAMQKAVELANECEVLEYGIQVIEMNDMIFYGDL
jgi:hypothetical protein